MIDTNLGQIENKEEAKKTKTAEDFSLLNIIYWERCIEIEFYSCTAICRVYLVPLSNGPGPLFIRRLVFSQFHFHCVLFYC